MDNTPNESFWSTLQRELLAVQGPRSILAAAIHLAAVGDPHDAVRRNDLLGGAATPP